MARHNSSEYRDDINGLRAWAVAAVIAYHFGIPGFSGGFVGVDVFFVISGFLMTGIVLGGLERGGFSVFSFYLARARRILPALVVVCAVLLGVGWFTLLPAEYKMLATHVAYSLGFVSNVEYWLEAGYFDQASHAKWLLHTWSLSVEWQFYIFLPVLLTLVWKLRSGFAAQRAVIWLVLVTSLAWTIFATPILPTAAFFLLPTRAWEMMAGGIICSQLTTIKLSKITGRALEVVGLGIIAASAVLFGPESQWPGWRALIPVTGAMLVIASARQSAWTGNVIARWMGERSYSLYLWHWPVVVALTYLELADKPLAIAIGLAVTVLLGDLSYRWVEKTTRGHLIQIAPVPAWLTLAGAASIVGFASVLVWQHQGRPGRFDRQVELAAAATGDFNPRRDKCHASSGAASPSCVHGGTTVRAVILGDSHAGALVTGLVKAGGANGAGVLEWSYSACPFIHGMHQLPDEAAHHGPNYQCPQFQQWVDRQLEHLPAAIPVVIVNRYANQALGPNEDRGIAKPRMYFSSIPLEATPAYLDEFARHITATACALAARRQVFLVRPIPEMGVEVPVALARHLMRGGNPDVSISLAEYKQRNGWVLKAQDDAQRRCGVHILDPLPYMCDGERCHGVREGHSVYYDDDHLSEYGSARLAEMFKPVFALHSSQRVFTVVAHDGSGHSGR